MNPMWIPAGIEALSAIAGIFGGDKTKRVGAFTDQELRDWRNRLYQITGGFGGQPNLEIFGIGPESLKRQYSFGQSQLAPQFDYERRRARTDVGGRAGIQPGLLSDRLTSIGAGQTRSLADLLAQLQIGQQGQQAGVMTSLMSMVNSLIQA